MDKLTWNDLSPLQREIFYFIFEMCTVSFINLHRRFPELFPGRGKITGRDKEGHRSIFWAGISQEFAAVLTSLRKDGLIHMTQCSKTIYLHDLNLVTDDLPTFMDEPLWIPIVYDATKKGKSLIQSLEMDLLKQLMGKEIDYQLKLYKTQKSS